MRNNINRNSGRRALGAFFVFALVGAVSLAAPNAQELTTTPTSASRVWLNIRVPMRPNGVTANPQEMELNFTGANGAVSGLSAKSGKQTFKFERAGEALQSCPQGRVKQCDSLSLKAGGELTACACVPPGPVTQTKEHILLARQVGVPSLMTESSQPEKIAAASSGHEFALSDKTMLRASATGERTCWINKKLPLSLCY